MRIDTDYTGLLRLSVFVFPSRSTDFSVGVQTAFRAPFVFAVLGV